MSFGRNPHVPKAEAAELKAEAATDDRSRAQARREAAHLWDRAAEREKPGKVRSGYEASAARNRELADAPPAPRADRDELVRRIRDLEGGAADREPQSDRGGRDAGDPPIG